MVAASDDRQLFISFGCFFRNRSDLDFLTISIIRLLKSTCLFFRQITQTLSRNVNNAEFQRVPRNEGDVDREFARLLDEFLRSIKRIDNPKTIPIARSEEHRVGKEWRARGEGVL